MLKVKTDQKWCAGWLRFRDHQGKWIMKPILRYCGYVKKNMLYITLIEKMDPSRWYFTLRCDPEVIRRQWSGIYRSDVTVSTSGHPRIFTVGIKFLQITSGLWRPVTGKKIVFSFAGIRTPISCFKSQSINLYTKAALKFILDTS